jgi:hypothetical protein
MEGRGIRIEPMAVGWGALVGMLGLAASSGAELWLRAVVIIGAFLIGGFLSGVRTLDRRLPTALAVWVVGWFMWGVIVIVLIVANWFGGPAEPEFAPGSDGAAILIALGSLVAALLGALAADRRYSGGTARRRY